MTPQRLRELALELPNVTEEAHEYGRYYRVRGHLIAAMGRTPRTVSFFVSKDTARRRKQSDPGINLRFWPTPRSIFAPTPIGINIRLRSLSDDEARALLQEAWQLAPSAWLTPPDYRGGA